MKSLFFKSILLVVFLAVAVLANAQIKYYSNGKLTIGNTEPYSFYHTTFSGNGIYMNCNASNFFQIDCSPAATRLASHYDQVVFYNTASGVYNSIQVKNVYNYSDARAKININPLGYGLNVLSKLNAVSYDFKDKNEPAAAAFRVGGDGKEIGLLAQEVEKVLPNIVLTDPDGNKLINYTAIIPIMIQSIKELKAEVEALKANK